MEFNEFVSHCLSKNCLRRTMYNEKTCLKEYKQKNCYRKYHILHEKHLKKQEELQNTPKELPQIDEKWVEVRTKVFKRDKYSCQYTQYLKKSKMCEYFMAISLTKGNEDAVDPAHIFGKGAFPHLKYDEDNVITINHLFHMRLDEYRHPLTGEGLTKEERNEVFLSMLSEDRKKRLMEKRSPY